MFQVHHCTVDLTSLFALLRPVVVISIIPIGPGNVSKGVTKDSRHLSCKKSYISSKLAQYTCIYFGNYSI